MTRSTDAYQESIDNYYNHISNDEISTAVNRLLEFDTIENRTDLYSMSIDNRLIRSLTGGRSTEELIIINNMYNNRDYIDGYTTAGASS